MTLGPGEHRDLEELDLEPAVVAVDDHGVEGLTDVRVDLTVTDTVTGAVRQYSNQQGEKFRPILDTSAFPSCP